MRNWGLWWRGLLYFYVLVLDLLIFMNWWQSQSEIWNTTALWQGYWSRTQGQEDGVIAGDEGDTKAPTSETHILQTI